MNYKQNKDGSWTPAEATPPMGAVAKVEFWLRRRGFNRLSLLLAAWDERKLGK